MRKRHGFTLIELLVAMALIIFIMSILSYAFVAATTAFRDLKAAGDMAEKLRSATTILQRDLAADHFDGRRRLSDLNFWSNGPPRQGFFRIWQNSTGTLESRDLDGIPLYRSTDHALHFTVHLRGNRQTDFFSAQVPGLKNLTTGLPSPAYPDPNSLSPLTQSLTLGLLPSRYENLDGNQSTYNSQWAEVVYFLRPALDSNGNQETANGTLLFTLYRRQLLLVPDNSLLQANVNTPPVVQPAQLTYFTPSNAQASPYLEVSCWQGYPPGYPQPSLYFNGPMDVTIPQRRFGMNFVGYPSTAVAGGVGYPIMIEQTNDTKMLAADVLLTDVVSFDVRVLLPTANANPLPAPLPGQPDTDPFVDLFHKSIQQTYNNGNLLYKAPPPPGPGGLYLPPGGPQVFDTWTSVRDPLAGILTAAGPPLNAFAQQYDYSSWGQSGAAQLAASNTTQVSIPLWNSTLNPPAPRILAIQIQLRIWDTKTQQTRQVTIVQAM